MPRSPDLERGRRAYREREWSAAHEALARADAATPLRVEDLERLAVAAYLTGRDDEHATALERAHEAYRDAGDQAAAARCAFWIGLMQMLRGEMGHAGGWISRAKRLLGARACAEQGYLLLPLAEQQLHQGDFAAATKTGARAVAIGERFHDRDLTAVGRHLQGRALLQRGRSFVAEGLALLDEVMVEVLSDELSPVMTGLLYCSVIEACYRAYALDRSSEWTAALDRWCSAQQGLVAFTTVCLVRRAEIMEMHGDWPGALKEAQRACERVAHLPNRRPSAAALYQQAEVFRLRGEFRAAESAYGAASAGGWDPQPGLALLRLAQGKTDVAVQAIRRAAATASDPFERSRLLPSLVEISLAVGDVEGAREGVRELEALSKTFGASMLETITSQARGQVQLAEGDAAAAAASLRRALVGWETLQASWRAANARVLVGLSCDALGDGDGATLEFSSARAVFTTLGATPDLARLDALRRVAPLPTHPLSARELDVIRLLAVGKTNRAIAAELRISEKTVARHASNIFAKLGLSTRSAAAAWAWQHGLI